MAIVICAGAMSAAVAYRASFSAKAALCALRMTRAPSSSLAAAVVATSVATAAAPFETEGRGGGGGKGAHDWYAIGIKIVGRKHKYQHFPCTPLFETIAREEGPPFQKVRVRPFSNVKKGVMLCGELPCTIVEA